MVPIIIFVMMAKSCKTKIDSVNFTHIDSHIDDKIIHIRNFV